ncbi:MAG: glycosyl transferase family 51 [Desulfobacterales bacterium]|nr:MAG: glycosyl transferase family 51 [Desulfobacterales bacterium]
MIKKLFITFFIFGLLSAAVLGGFLYWTVVLEPGDEITEENIRGILGKESPVYYHDGVSPLGVFFADAHRQYVEYQQIPASFINALIAAEDNRFFSHFGFDIVGILRAAIKNIQARRVVQGGSTLTQQTAKNLFKRKGRSWQAKLKELLFALRLEYHYSKEQILEFYINQFYVSGNGLGLGVAARYYFDKKPSELTLLESAYIAGSVKRPNYYNPFIKRDEAGVKKARERGRIRAGYVLKNMKQLGMIGEREYQQALATEILFKKGAVGYEQDYVMDLVTEAVASDQVVEALAAHGIDNIATSGIRIITTVNKDLQTNTLYSLRKQLSYLDVRLRGYLRDEVQQELRGLRYKGDGKPEQHAFLFGEILSISKEREDYRIIVSFGRKKGRGIIDHRGLHAMVDAQVKWRNNRWDEAEKEDYEHLLQQLKAGDRVWVSVRELAEDGLLLLDLERFPLVKGGAIVMQDGQIMSVAGGVENRFFNRAIYGKRTMGSSYKPFVFAAAMQLGWNAADRIPNRRDVFVYQNQPYFPRPDHKNENQMVSMSWAGVRSENLASVWLAYHLCDHLTKSQLIEVASHVGLAPRMVDGEPEPYRLFRSRLRDRYGIILNQDMIRKAAYRKTISTIETDLVFEGLDDEYEVISTLHYGLGYHGFSDQIERKLDPGRLDDSVDKTKELSVSERKELVLRRKLLSANFLRLSRLRRALREYAEPADGFGTRFSFPIDDTGSREPGLFYDRVKNEYVFDLPEYLPGQLSLVDRNNFQLYLAGLDQRQRERFVAEIKLGGILSVSAFDFVDQHVDQEFARMRKMLPYHMDVLEYVDDYRTMVGLRYLAAFGKALGIESTLEPVLSFPLGSNVVTLLETTRLYQTLVTGETVLFRGKNGSIDNTLAIIDRIESEDGVVLYRPEPERKQVIDPETSLALAHILENTVKFGTGRYADKQVKLTEGGDEQNRLTVPVPLLGKTGTANRYTNASFFGYLPSLNAEGNGMTIDHGYGIGVYVGYDDNKAMRRKSTRITGAAGALPAWTEIVNGILRLKSYESKIDPVDLSFYGLILRREKRGQLNLGVTPNFGGKLIFPPKKVDEVDRYQPSIMTFGTITGSTFQPSRNYKPFWLWQQNSRQPAVTTTIVEQDL